METSECYTETLRKTYSGHNKHCLSTISTWSECWSRIWMIILQWLLRLFWCKTVYKLTTFYITVGGMWLTELRVILLKDSGLIVVYGGFTLRLLVKLELLASDQYYSTRKVASSTGSRGGEGEREPGALPRAHAPNISIIAQYNIPYVHTPRV